MTDQIAVTFAELQATQEQTQATVAGIAGSLADLKAYLAPMVATWQGAAASDYRVVQARWDRAAADLNDVLAAIGRALGAANEGFQATESQNAARFC
jgi:6 kDa early secretory antigenic target